MKDIIEYLKEPMIKGVFNRVYSLEIEKLELFLKDIAEDYGHEGQFDAELMIENDFMSWSSINSILKDCVSMYVLNNMTHSFNNFFLITEDIIKQGVSDKLKEASYTDENGAKYRLLTEICKKGFVDSLLSKIPDIFYLNSNESLNPELTIFEVTSIKEDTLKKFEGLITELLHIKESFNILKKRKTYSSRYVFRPYYLVIKLWLENESSINIPKDLYNLIKDAALYHERGEWRTSVILSAIIVESILADLYEEEKKEYAPDIPLGALFDKIKEIVKIPNEIKNSIDSVNRARISAVHRSRFPVSDRDAVIALYGTTKTTMWFIENY